MFQVYCYKEPKPLSTSLYEIIGNISKCHSMCWVNMYCDSGPIGNMNKALELKLSRNKSDS